MSELVLLAVVVAVVVLAIGPLATRKRGGPSASPYQPAKALFSAAERSFLGVLDQAVGNEYRVFGKVRVADVAAVKRGLSNSARQSALNRITGKHFDFIVCRADDLAVVCAVELNDKSHATKRAQSRDAFLAEVCGSIGLPLFTVSAKRSYPLQEIRDQFMAAIASPPEDALSPEVELIAPELKRDMASGGSLRP